MQCLCGFGISSSPSIRANGTHATIRLVVPVSNSSLSNCRTMVFGKTKKARRNVGPVSKFVFNHAASS